MYNLNQLKNYATILKSGKETFWASDFGFRGGDINGLTRDFIKPTGRTKTEFINVDGGGDIFRKVEVQEWCLRDFAANTWVSITKEEIDRNIKRLISIADTFRELGY